MLFPQLPPTNNNKIRFTHHKTTDHRPQAAFNINPSATRAEGGPANTRKSLLRNLFGRSVQKCAAALLGRSPAATDWMRDGDSPSQKPRHDSAHWTARRRQMATEENQHTVKSHENRLTYAQGASVLGVSEIERERNPPLSPLLLKSRCVTLHTVRAHMLPSGHGSDVTIGATRLSRAAGGRTQQRLHSPGWMDDDLGALGDEVL